MYTRTTAASTATTRTTTTTTAITKTTTSVASTTKAEDIIWGNLERKVEQNQHRLLTRAYQQYFWNGSYQEKTSGAS